MAGEIYFVGNTQIRNLGGKDKKDERKKVILQAYTKNPQLLVGYTDDNVKAQKVLRKQKV